MHETRRILTTRPLSIQGRSYAAGELVDASRWPAGKLEQLIAQRRLRVEGGALQPLEAARTFTIERLTERITFQRGDAVPAETFTADKTAQLLERRYLQPALVRARRDMVTA